MKKIALLSIALILSACSDSNVKEQQVQKIDEFKVYDGLTLKVSDQQLQNLINESIVEYELLVDKTRDEFQKHKNSVEKEIGTNLKELNTDVISLQNDFDSKCKKITESNVNECNALGETIANAKTALNKVQTAYNNEMGEINVAEKNTLLSLQTQMRNNINKLLSQQ